LFDEKHPCFSKALTILHAVYGTYFAEEKLEAFELNGNRFTEQENEAPVLSKLLDGVYIYPNPASTQFIINNQSQKQYDYEVCNINGQILLKGSSEPFKNDSLSTATLPTGIYFVNLLENGRILKTSKLVIVK